MTLRLLSYNIRRAGLGREEAIATVIAASAPDLVVLQEATSPPAVARVAAAAGMTQWASKPKVSVAFLSRQPVKAWRWTRARWARHAFLEITLDSGAVMIDGLLRIGAVIPEDPQYLDLLRLLKP